MAGYMPSAYVQAKILDGKRYYMHQPEGFVNPQHPNHVLQLQKALYGLPIMGHKWANLFSSSLVELGFHQSMADPCLYCLDCNGEHMIMTVVVDDTLSYSTYPKLEDEVFKALIKSSISR